MGRNQRRPSGTTIEKVYLAVVEQDDGESVYSLIGPHSEAIPVVAFGDKGLTALGEYARGQADATGQTVSIICFTTRSRHETFRPSTTQGKRM